MIATTDTRHITVTFALSDILRAVKAANPSTLAVQAIPEEAGGKSMRTVEFDGAHMKISYRVGSSDSV